ncbi:MAG: S1 RNA-binding domain-containing protein [Planctomycetaceae bacterium]|jgi:small subunit ribosomal protein S1|nr:S1 RNA-binding domain-containing protein [Planctomycetaceae bacterium]
MFSEIENSGKVPATSSDSSNTSSSSNTQRENLTQDKSATSNNVVSNNPAANNPASDKPSNDLPETKIVRPKRLIGSQRHPEAYRIRPKIQVVDPAAETNASNALDSQNAPNSTSTADQNLPNATTPQTTQDAQKPIADNNAIAVDNSLQKINGEQLDALDKNSTVATVPSVAATVTTKASSTSTNNIAAANSASLPKALDDDDDDGGVAAMDLDKKILSELTVSPAKRVEIPKLRNGKMSDDLEAEFNAVMGAGGISGGAGEFDSMLQNASELADKEVIEPGTKLKAKVLAIRGDSLFIDLNVREQGVVLINMFPVDATPKVGDEIEVTVGKLDIEEGLYEVTVPLAAADVRDWSQIQEGMIVEAKIIKSNSGGLECEVNRLRGFMPVSQIDIFRVDNIEQYVGQKLTCIVEEVNIERRNLIVSRRSMLYREREEQKKQLMAEIAPGQVKEGLVRKIIDGGVFVDLGGVDGFIPISKLSWGRVRHPSDVVSEGKRVVVRVDKIEEGTNRISLTYRDDASNPWSNIYEHFQEKTQARGKVVKITPFGAFIELMPGVDGLVLISELANRHVNNVHEILKEGEWVDVFIVAIDTETKKIKLSIRQLIPTEPEIDNITTNETNNDKDKNNQQTQDTKSNIKKKQEGVPAPIKIKNVQKGPLKGGIGNNNNESNAGLKW